MKTTYPSQVDGWLKILALALLVFMIYVSWVTVTKAGARGGPMLMFTFLAVGLMFWLLLSTRYELDRELLLVRSGPFTWRIPLVQITGMSLSNNWLASPALSLQRLRIEYTLPDGRARFVLISPSDREAFMKQVEALRQQAAGG